MSSVPVPPHDRRRRRRRAGSTAVAGLLTAGLALLGLAVPGTAAADTRPVPPGEPATVAADALPTVQVNGVVWSQVVVGNTVYAAGRFTSARPAGAAAGTQETVRNNLLAYDIRTGALVASFAPDLNAQAMTLAASPDGRRLYVGGDFTRANGQVRNRVAAYDTATGALVSSFAPTVSSQVRALAATNDTVYLGGTFSALGGVSRSRLAAVRASDGGLLPWASVPGPGSTAGNRDGNTATSSEVMALVVTGGGSQVVASGRFDTLNGAKATGVGALDAATGATRPFAINQLITNQGVNSAVYSLSTDGTAVYGTGYDYFGPGNFEGSFAARADGGSVIAVNGCHGDSYSSFPVGGVLYIATHAHQCAPIAGFPEQNPRVNKFATAVTTTATGTTTDPSLRNTNLRGQPAPTLLPWFPTMSAGQVTGQLQAGWSVSGNSQYVVYGGEFPRVNGVAQQGLVRYAVSALAPNDRGPEASAAALRPNATSTTAGQVTVTWPATWDMDNAELTYQLFRDGGTTPVNTVTATSSWWDLPELTFTDPRPAGSTASYRVVVTDPFGNTVTSSPSNSVTVASAPSAYANRVLADAPDQYWRLGEPSGTTALDHAGTTNLTTGAGVTRGRAGAIGGDAAVTTNGTATGIASTRAATVPTPANAFSVEAWVRTTSGGLVAQYSDSPTAAATNPAGAATTVDRSLYVDAEGRLTFGTKRGDRLHDGPQPGARGRRRVAPRGGHGRHRRGGAPRRRCASGERADVHDGQRQAGRVLAPGQRLADRLARRPGERVAGRLARRGRDLPDDAHRGAGAGAPRDRHRRADAQRGADGPVTATTDGLKVAVDAAASTDPDGTVASVAWDFGDGGHRHRDDGVAHLHRRGHLPGDGHGDRRRRRHGDDDPRGHRHRRHPAAGTRWTRRSSPSTPSAARSPAAWAPPTSAAPGRPRPARPASRSPRGRRRSRGTGQQHRLPPGVGVPDLGRRADVLLARLGADRRGHVRVRHRPAGVGGQRVPRGGQGRLGRPGVAGALAAGRRHGGLARAARSRPRADVHGRDDAARAGPRLGHRHDQRDGVGVGRRRGRAGHAAAGPHRHHRGAAGARLGRAGRVHLGHRDRAGRRPGDRAGGAPGRLSRPTRGPPSAAVRCGRRGPSCVRAPYPPTTRSGARRSTQPHKESRKRRTCRKNALLTTGSSGGETPGHR
jgi:hypothetical protein